LDSSCGARNFPAGKIKTTQLAEEIAKKHVFLLEESVWHRYRPAILASWHVFSGRYSDLFPNPVANLQLLAMESPRDADCERSAEFLTPA
jgi:hypothetical protein